VYMIKCKKFTFTDLIIIFFIGAVFVVILPPVLASVAKISKSALCQSNLKKCYDATIKYMNDHNGWRVNDAHNGRQGEWGRILSQTSYLKDRKAMSCSNDQSLANLSWSKTYGSWISNKRTINMKSLNFNKVSPSRLLIYADSFRCDDKVTPRRSINKLTGNPSGPHHGIVTFMHAGNKAGVITYDGSAKMAVASDFAGAPPFYKNAKIVLEHLPNNRFRPIKRVQKYIGASYLVASKALKTDMAKKHPLSVSSAVKRGKLNYKGENHNGYKVLDMWQSPMPDPKKKNSGYPPISGVKYAVIYKGNWKNGGYNHHSNLFKYKDLFYASWSNQPYGEDCPGQRVLYSTSKDGLNWSPAKELFPPPVKMGDRKSEGPFLASSGFFIWDGRLFGRASGHQKLYWQNKARTSRKPYYDKYHIYPKMVHYSYICREIKPDGKLGKIFVYGNKRFKANYPIVKYSQVESGFKMPHDGLKNIVVQGPDTKRLCEPTPYKTKDGKFCVLLRDDNYSHRKYASFSDDGKNWPTAEPTNIPDSPSYSIAAFGTDGSVLFIGNHMAPRFDIASPRHYGRDPLMITYSPDGYKLTKSYAISSGPHKYTIPREKVFGRGGGAQYPAVIIENDKAYIMYSSGKEDIRMSVFPLSAIGVSKDIKYKRIR
jgi:BNR repeat-like domain